MRNQGFHYTQIELHLHSCLVYSQEKSNFSAMTALKQAAYSTTVFEMNSTSYKILLTMYYYTLYLFKMSINCWNQT